MLGQDIGIDLGTSTILIYVKGRGIITKEPAVVAVDKESGKVLALTEGEKVRIESIADPSRYFVANYLDVIVVPADLGAYRIVNLGEGDVTMHKTCLKEGFEACAK